MVNEDNPAGRLYTILREAERKNGKEQARKAWASVFGIEESNETEILRSLLSLQDLVEDVHILIENNPQLNSELFLKSFPNLRRAVSAQNLTNPWDTYKIGINPETMTRLEFCSEVLGAIIEETIVSSDEINELKKVLSELTEFVEESSIEHELKVFLLIQIEELRRGIFDYKIHGAAGIRKALESVIGTTVTQNDKYQDIKATNEDVLNRLGILLDKVDEVISKALKIKKVLGKVKKLLSLSWIAEEDSDET